jgi:hypothetical protein
VKRHRTEVFGRTDLRRTSLEERRAIERKPDSHRLRSLVEVPDLHEPLAAGRAEPVLGDAHGDALADDISSQPNPFTALELEPDARRLGQRTMKRPWHGVTRKAQQPRAGSLRVGGETAQ